MSWPATTDAAEVPDGVPGGGREAREPPLSHPYVRRVDVLLGAITASMSLARGILLLENRSSPVFSVLSGVVLLMVIVYFLSVRGGSQQKDVVKVATRSFSVRLVWRRAVAISVTAVASVLFAAAGFVALVRHDLALGAVLLLLSVGCLVFLWGVRWPDELDSQTNPSNGARW
jgi:hypothetical protein